MSQGNILGLHHIGVFVKDMAVSVDFYKRLGFNFDSERQTDTGVKIAFLSAGSCVIELVERNMAPYRGAGVVDHIAMKVDDIEAAVAKANANGISVDAAKIGTLAILDNARNVFFEGPDGERLEFFSV